MSGAFPPVNSGPLNGAAPFLRLSKAVRRRFKIKNLKTPAVKREADENWRRR
jgi:hypothetical protein